ncbi:MAG: hypothetical protein DRI34_12415, partial [Deltaproteobacteria bacterium]
GETCDADDVEMYPACTVAGDCSGANVDCVDGHCRDLCITAADCPSTTQSCQDGLCVRSHCVSHQGGVCAGVACASDDDCPLQPCDAELGRCLTQPCLDSRQCPHQHCEIILGVCMSTPCADDGDCRGERGFTCNQVVGDPCDRDIDCPYDFCNLERKRCLITGEECQANTDCPGNTCSVRVLTSCLTDTDCPGGARCVNDVCVGNCSLNQNSACSADLDCSPNYCQNYFVCENDPGRGCVTSMGCPQTFCGADGRCINDPSISCNPATENNDNNCQVGTCNRDNGLGSCDTAVREPCASRDECPHYHCNQAVGECYYPVQVFCRAASDCPEPGMQCGPNGYCVMPCSSDAECPRARCQGRCVPVKAEDRTRCTDWFDPEKDCKVFGAPAGP